MTVRNAHNRQKKMTNSPVDTQKFHQEVKARLRKIDNPRLAAAFAARVALAALPKLADRAVENGFLWYWKEANRERRLFAVCRALQVGWLLSADLVPVNRRYAANAARDAVEAANTAQR